LSRYWTVAFLFILVACSQKGSELPALSPQALRSFHLSDDLKVELLTSEPDVMDPVEMVFDDNGRVYVAEMRDDPRIASPEHVRKITRCLTAGANLKTSSRSTIMRATCRIPRNYVVSARST
jgi:hypothetical protein